ncbi:MarR family transcriptional regulator [Vibrio comitans]
MSTDTIFAKDLRRMPALENSPLFLMTVLTRLHRNLVHGKLRVHADITLEMLLVMHIIFENQPIKQQSVADYLMYDRSTAKRTVDNMVKRGWVKTMKDDNNQKTKLLALTESGEEIKKVCSEVVIETRIEFMECLTEEENIELTRLCTKALSAHHK